MTDVFLYSGEVSPNDVKLRDPTVVAGKQNYVLTCAVGAYGYSGSAATLTYVPGVTKVDYTLVCAAGAYTYAGVAATLKFARSLSLAAGSYSYAGTATALKVARKLSLAAGAYTYAGTATGLKLERKLSLATGTYTYAGTATGLKVARKLALDAGAYGVTGQAATLTYVPGASAVAYTLDCAAGSYDLSGQAASFSYVSGFVPTGFPLFYSGGTVSYERRPRVTSPKSVRKAIKRIVKKSPGLPQIAVLAVELEKMRIEYKPIYLDLARREYAVAIDRNQITERIIAEKVKTRKRQRSEDELLLMMI